MALLAFSPLLSAQERSKDYRFIDDPCDPSFTLTVGLSVPGGWQKSTQARIAFNYQNRDNYRYLKISAWGVAFVRVSDGVHRKIGADLPFDAHLLTPPLKVVLKRSQWRLFASIDGRIVALADDAVGDAPDGRPNRIGVWYSDDIRPQEDSLRYQPTGDIFFADDFTRSPGEASEWTPLSGNWENTGIDGAVAREDMSANPFAYIAQKGKPGLTVTGRPFWDNYLVEVSAKSESTGAMGVCVYFQDDRNYLLFRWFSEGHSSRSGGEREIVLLRDGKEQVLARGSGGYVPRQWYRISAKVVESLIEIDIDGATVLASSFDVFGQGKAGLYSSGGGIVQFDDAAILSCHNFSDDFSQEFAGRWNASAEAAKVKSGWLLIRGGTALAGIPAPDIYRLQTQVKFANGGGGGIVFSNADPKNRLLLAVRDGTAQFVRVVNGKEATIGGAVKLGGNPLNLNMRVEEGIAQLLAGGRTALSVADAHIRPGQMGFFADPGKTMYAKFLRMEPIERDDSQTRLAQKFVDDPLMVGWANPKGEWIPASTNRGTVFWHRGEFFDDVEMDVTVGAIASLSGTLSALLTQSADTPDAGYRIDLTLNGGELQSVDHFRNDSPMKLDLGKPLPTVTPSSQLRLVKRGGAIAAKVDGNLLFSRSDGTPIVAHRLGMISRGFGLDVARIHARSEYLADFTFANAPVEWWQGRGEWKVTARWPCQKDWSWFGGTDEVAPILWSKHTYPGDVVAEFYCGVKMSLPKEPGYSNPGDLNITLCSDGKDLSSGYSFIFAGWGNSRTAILRGAKIVSETDAFRLVQPHSQNFSYHRHWYYVRVERIQGVVRFFIDGRLALQYEDPQPLAGGRLAFWSFHSGMMLARVRIWSDGTVDSDPFTLGGTPSASRDLQPNPNNTSTEKGFEDSTDGALPLWEGEVALSVDKTLKREGKSSLRVQNASTGGTMGVLIHAQPFDATQFPALRFFYRIPPEVYVNLYALVDGYYHAFVLTGDPKPGADVKVAGAVPGGRGDGEWHEAEVKLLEALRSLYPGRESFLVERLLVGNLSRSDYRQAGFGANGWGTAYHIDGFRLVGVKSNGSAG
ncbi:MAG: hypothetical protein COZ56_01930 [Armatimonadetes bacterium CG_4_8_14_3_um_filter_58_9]|nr:MAG: hypothetical protein COZ56_01930 [Armatimonadetes bacterium CG_4_8_14_3_um_filter_58_9]